MPETRIETEAYSEGKLVETITREVSDEELAVEAIERVTREANDQALVAYQNWDNLTLAQKEKVLKGLLGDFISRNRDRYIGD